MADSSINSSRDGLRTRISLLGRARDGKSDLAWEELLGYYEPFVSKVLGSMGFRGANLDDAKQQVFLRLWKGLQSYEREPERAKFRTWFATLIRNTALNIIRSSKRVPDGPSLDDDSLVLPPGMADEAEIESRVEEEWQQYVVELALERASKLFSGHAVDVFQRSLAGQSVEDIASQLNIKPNTVYILKHRVKAVLLKEIQILKIDLESFGDDPRPMSTPSQYIQLYEEAEARPSGAQRDAAAELCPLYHALQEAGLRYTDEEPIGKGGMKEVLRAYDQHTERHVALARPREGIPMERYDAFLREAHITARLAHPNIINVFDMGIDDQRRPFFTMELKSGLSLRQLLGTLRKASDELHYPYAKRLAIILRVCEAMAYAHSRHVLHLDLKPDNIQVGTFGEVQVCDWGMGEIERGVSEEHLSLALLDPDLYGDQLEPAVKGTPGYMAPEQEVPKAVKSAQTDIFALGCMLYELATLRKPADRTSHPPDSPAVAAIVRKACATNPADRYPDVEAMREDIRRHVTGYSPSAEQSYFFREARLFYRRNRLPCRLTLAFTTVLLGAALWFTSQLRQSYHEKTAALEATEHALAEARTARSTAEAAMRQAQLESAFSSALLASRSEGDLDGSQFLSNVMALDEEVSPVAINSLLREIDRALTRDSPDHDELVTMKGQVLFMAQRFSEAEEFYKIRAGAQQDLRDLIPAFAPLVRDDGLLPPADLIRLFQQMAALKISRHPLIEKMLIYDTLTRKSPADSAPIFEAALHISNPRWTDAVFHYDPAEQSLRLAGSGLHTLYRRGAKRSETAIPVRSLLRVLDIRALDLRGSSLTDLYNLEGIKLQSLDLRNTPVTNLAPLAALPTLRELTISPGQFNKPTLAKLPPHLTVHQLPPPSK